MLGTNIIRANGSLPKRGEKDFEPNGTALQSSALADSRNAMYTALQGERGHAGKLHVTAVWHADIGKAKVDVARGPHFNTLGKSDSNGSVWLFPEEVIYLVERGSLECFFPEGSPMSLQAAYAACIRNEGDLERLQVYTYLKKLGFIVARSKSYENDYSTKDNSPYKIVPEQHKITSILYGYAAICLLNARNLYTTASTLLGVSPAPLSKPVREIVLSRAVYTSYPQLYDDLDIIPYHKPPHTNTIHKPFDTPEPEYPYRVAFNVWKPTAGSFKKSAPGDPDFRIAVASTRDTRAPTLAQAMSLLNSVPVTETGYMVNNSKKKRAVEAAAAAKAAGKTIEPKIRNQTWVLKDGWRNVILAIIDAGVISFTKIADSGFGEEKVYHLPSKTGQNNAGNQGKGGNKKPKK